MVLSPPEPPRSVAERLADAQKGAGEPARRVGELETALREALDRSDYASAQIVKDDLAAARQELATAEAAVAALRMAVDAIAAQQAEDGRAIEQQRQRDAIQKRLAVVQCIEREAVGEMDAEVEHFWAALTAAQNVYRGAVILEQRAGMARTEAHQLRVQLGEVPPGGRVSSPNAASGLPEWHPVVAALLKWSRR